MIDDGYDYDPENFRLDEASLEFIRTRLSFYLEEEVNKELALDSINPNAVLAVIDIIFAICFENYFTQVQDDTPVISEFIVWITDYYIGDLHFYDNKDFSLLAQYVLSALGIDRQSVIQIAREITTDISRFMQVELQTNANKVESEFAAVASTLLNSDFNQRILDIETSYPTDTDLLNLAREILLNVMDYFRWDLRQYFVETYRLALKHYAILLSNFLKKNYPVFTNFVELEKQLYISGVIDSKTNQPFDRFSNC